MVSSRWLDGYIAGDNAVEPSCPEDHDGPGISNRNGSSLVWCVSVRPGPGSRDTFSPWQRWLAGTKLSKRSVRGGNTGLGRDTMYTHALSLSLSLPLCVCMCVPVGTAAG